MCYPLKIKTIIIIIIIIIIIFIIRWDFYSVVWVMPQGWDFGALGVPRGSNNYFFFKHGHEAYQIDGDNEQHKMHIIFSS